jgi:hypothetical protein
MSIAVSIMSKSLLLLRYGRPQLIGYLQSLGVAEVLFDGDLRLRTRVAEFSCQRVAV